MGGDIEVYAGELAFEMIRDQGLEPGDVEVVAGAAGGPKWLVLDGLDRAIFSSFFMHRTAPLFLIGSSAGAWRFAALAQGGDMAAYDHLQGAYIHQRFTGIPSAKEVTREGRAILEAFLDEGGIARIFSHPFMRLNVCAVRCAWPLSSENRGLLGLAMLVAACLNGMNRRLLGMLLTRTLFYDPRSRPPFFSMQGLPTTRVPLTTENIRAATLASGSIPLLMQGVTRVPGAPQGIYRDGGLLDYQMDIPFQSKGLVLFPHYMNRIVTGWFDKYLAWRTPVARHLERMVLVCPSAAFVRRLPLAKIPDRDDFKRFRGRDDVRIEYWQRVVRESARLEKAFLEAIQGGRIRHMVRPMAAIAGEK